MIIEDDIRELNKQITQTFVRVVDQPNFKHHIGFYCHFEKLYDEGD